jgi:hypothetical protein
MAFQFPKANYTLVKGVNSPNDITYGNAFEKHINGYLSDFYDNKHYEVVWKDDPALKTKRIVSRSANLLPVMSQLPREHHPTPTDPYALLDFEIYYNPHDLPLDTNGSVGDEELIEQYQELVESNTAKGRQGGLKRPTIFVEVKSRKFFLNGELRTIDYIRDNPEEFPKFQGLSIPTNKLYAFKLHREKLNIPYVECFYINCDMASGVTLVCKIPSDVNKILANERETDEAKSGVSNTKQETSVDIKKEYWSLLTSPDLESLFVLSGLPRQGYFDGVKRVTKKKTVSTPIPTPTTPMPSPLQHISKKHKETPHIDTIPKPINPRAT